MRMRSCILYIRQHLSSLTIMTSSFCFWIRHRATENNVKMPRKSKNKQKKGRKSTPSPKAKRLENRKKNENNVERSSAAAAAAIEDNEEASLPEILHSKVFTENPQTVQQTSFPVEMDTREFWKFLFSDQWEGRVRVCEGYLMTKINETFECFAQKKRIGKTHIVRQFNVPLSSFIEYAGAERALSSKVGKSSNIFDNQNPFCRLVYRVMDMVKKTNRCSMNQSFEGNCKVLRT